ncbi:MAG: TPM domain-containing protein [Anaerovoracaceae bacterium]
MNMKLKQGLANRHVLRPSSAIIPVLIILLMMSLPVLSSAAYGSVISQSDSFYVADEADVISSDTEKYITEKNAELENLCGGQIVVVTVDFLDGMDIEDYAYKLFKDWKIGDEDKDNGILLLLAIGEENYWCMQGKGLENALTSGDIDDILWNYLEDDFAAGDYDSGVRSVFDALYRSVSDVYGGSSEYDGSGSSTSDYDYTSAASDFSRIIKMVLIVFLVVLVLLIITSIFFGRKNKGSRGGGFSGSDYGGSHTSRNRTRPIFIPTSRPSRPSRSSRTTVSGSRPGSSRSSFGGGSRSSSRGGGMGHGGGGSSRGGGAGRRGR